MTDKKWYNLMMKCQKHGKEHKRLIKLIEDEYFSRYGYYPSDVDDDWWIDTFHYTSGNIDFDKIKQEAENYNRLKVK
jgi:hypothetical protein